jgi:tetratricopeptide (TPR) repeat protein
MGGDEAAALASCGAALDREPGLAAARNNLAILHASVGRLDKAREVLLSAGDRRSGLYNMGILLLARHDYAAAAENFSEACREAPVFEDACRRATEARTLARSRTPSPL